MKRKPESPLWAMEEGFEEASFHSFCSRAPLYRHHHGLHCPAVLLPRPTALSPTGLQIDLALCYTVIRHRQKGLLVCGDSLESTMCPRCQPCHIRPISILVPSQMVVDSPGKTPVLQDLHSHFRMRPETFSVRLSSGSCPIHTLHFPFLGLIFKGTFLLSNDSTCDSPVEGSASSSAPKDCHCSCCSGGRAALEAARHCRPSSSKMTKAGFGRRKSSKTRPGSKAALQEIPFHLQATCRLARPSCDLPAPSCKAALERSPSPRDVFQQDFVSSFTVFFLSYFQTLFPLLPTQIRLIRTSPQGKGLYTDRLPLQRIKQTRLFLFKFY